MHNLAISAELVKPENCGIHDFEHIGSILRRLRAGCEAKMTPDFDQTLSLTIDSMVQQEEALCLLDEGG